MPSNNQINNALEFTPTFGTQHRFIIGVKMTSKKSLVLLVLFSTVILVLSGQNSGWEWVRSFGGVEVNRYDYADPGENFNFVSCDASNNIYVAGNMLDTAIAGDIELQGNGDFDIVVAKLNPQGQYLWATNLGGLGMDLPSGLSLDSDGNAYLTGIFSGTLRLGGFTLQSRGDTDIFVAKINTEGIWQWVRQAGSQIASDDEFEGEILDGIGEFSIDIKTNEQGNSVVMGIFHGLAYFGTHTLNCSGEEWFLACIDSNGNWTWVKSLGDRISGETIRSMAMTLDQEQQVIIAASAGSVEEIRESALGDDGNVIPEPSSEAKTAENTGFFVLAKHDSNGETLFERTITKASFQIKRIISDETGGVFIAGIGNGNEYGGQSSETHGIAFVSRVDSLGSFNLIRAICSNNYDGSTLNLALGNDSRLYVVSEAENIVRGFPYRASGEHQAMLSSYDTDGNFLWAQSFGENPSYIRFEAPGLILDNQNRIIVSGRYGGAMSLGRYRLNSDNWGDAFVGRLTPHSR